MFRTITKRTTRRTGLTGVCRIDKLNPDTGSFGLVGNKRLQLRPCPAVQAGAHTLTGLDPFADIGQILHGDRAAFVSYCFRDNRLTDFVIHVGDMASFAAGDFLQQLSCRLRAVALKSASESKELVAVVPEFAATEELSGADGGDVVFAKIDAGNGTVISHGNFGKVKHQVEEELPLTADQLRFLGDASFKETFLELTQLQRNNDAPLGGEQGDGVTLDTVCPLVEMDGVGNPKLDQRPDSLFKLRVVGNKGFVRLRNGGHGVAGHLGAKIWNNLPDVVVAKVVKRYPVLTGIINCERHKHVTGTGKLPLQQNKTSILIRRCCQFYTDGAFHSAPSLDVLGALDVALDGFGADVAGCADVVGRRPKTPTPKGLLQLRKHGKEF